MTPDEFEDICTSLFGKIYYREAAAQLRIDPRNVARYSRGEKPIPDEIATILRFWRGKP